MVNKHKKFCYREVDFPKEFYTALLFISVDENRRLLYPMRDVFLNLKELNKEIKSLKKGSKKEKPAPIYGVLIVKIKFNKTFPLKKECWETSEEDSLIDRNYCIKQFIKMAEGVCQFYNIIVLPKIYDLKNRKNKFVSWIPVLISSDDQKIENLIKNSDEYVNPSTKNIGLYSIEYIRGFDLDTGEFVKSQKEIDLEEANC